MRYQSFDDLYGQLQDLGKRTIVVAGAHDRHAMEAVLASAREGIADFQLVGNADAIRRIGRELGENLDGAIAADTQDDETAATEAVALVRRQKNNCFLMKGGLNTATLMRAVLDQKTGIRLPERTMSHVALLQAPAYHKLLVITDGGMIPHPTLEQKEIILRNALELARRLRWDWPKAAVLTASESLNKRQPETGDAAQIKTMAVDGSFGDCIVEGPISFDLAVSGESAAIKGYDSPVAGDADILLTPDMASGNMLSKCLIHMGGAKMAGCIMGAGAPIVLTSRGSSAEEKRLSILLAAVTSGVV